MAWNWLWVHIHTFAAGQKPACMVSVCAPRARKAPLSMECRQGDRIRVGVVTLFVLVSPGPVVRDSGRCWPSRELNLLIGDADEL